MNDHLSALSEGERECLRLVSQGYNSKQIARLLPYDISAHTVDQRLRTAMRKLRVPNRQDAARILAESEAGRPYQPLIYQAEHLVPAGQTSPMRPSKAREWLKWLKTMLLATPPIGGLDNDLNWKQRNIEIIRVASLATAAILGLILVIAGALAAFH